jgi:hypothetical protein
VKEVTLHGGAMSVPGAVPADHGTVRHEITQELFVRDAWPMDLTLGTFCA